MTVQRAGRSNPVRRLGAAVGVLLALAVAGIGVLWVVEVATKDTVSESFTITPTGDEFTVDGGNGEITLTASADDVVHVKRIVQSGLREPTFEETPNGSGARLAADCPFQFVATVCEVDYEVAVPEGLTVTLRTSSGDVRVNGVPGTVAVDTNSGDVDVRDTTGPVRVHTNSGDLLAVGVRGDRFEVETTSGDVELDFAAEPREVGVDTNSGDVRLTVPGSGYAVDTDSNSGDVTVNVPTAANADRRIRAHTNSGDIDINR